MSSRPDNVKSWRELWSEKEHSYPGRKEPHASNADFSSAFGFERVGAGIDVVQPGRRSSLPHSHSAEEEMVFVVKGRPKLWQDGEVYQLEEGDVIGWKPGTGVAHSILNDTDEEVRLLSIGERNKQGDRLDYPLSPARNAQLGRDRPERLWTDVPQRRRGTHDAKTPWLRANFGDET